MQMTEAAAGGIITGPLTLKTALGDIHEWACVPENLPNHPSMAFFGKRRTGKSTTITNIAYHCCQHIPFGIVMSDTAYCGYWDKLVPKKYIVQGLRQDVLDWLIHRQKKAIAKYGVKDPRVRAFIILDDVIADQKTIRWSADLASFFVQGRHLAITVFIASQYAKGIGPMVRGNCDYVFLQPIFNESQRRVLHDMEAGFLKFDEFAALMDEVICEELLEGNCPQDPKKNVRILVCAAFQNNGDVQSKFFHFSPIPIDQLPPFRLCHPKYWVDNDKPVYHSSGTTHNVTLDLQRTKDKMLKNLGR